MRTLLLAAGYVNLDITADLSRVPGLGERVTAGSISRSPGGMTANMACAAAQLGMEVRFFGVVGRDEAGREAVAELERFGVDTKGMTVTEGSTTTSLILLGPGGDRAIVSEPLTFDYGALREAVKETWDRRKCLHVDGYRLPEAASLLREARRAGFTVSADLDGIEPSDLPGMLPEIAGALDITFVNRDLAAAISEEPGEVTRNMIDHGVQAVAVTLGERGALVADGRGVARIAPPVVEVMDTTGAGDSFAADFLSEWMEDRDAQRAGTFAVAASAISVGAAGARGRLPHRLEVEQSLDQSIGGEIHGSVERRGAR